MAREHWSRIANENGSLSRYTRLVDPDPGGDTPYIVLVVEPFGDKWSAWVEKNDGEPQVRTDWPLDTLEAAQEWCEAQVNDGRLATN